MILNLTGVPATREQKGDGVVDPGQGTRLAIRQLLTFEELPTPEEVCFRARDLVEIALEQRATKAMIAGPPYLMKPLEEELVHAQIVPLYSFSTREVQERYYPDGSVQIVVVSRHHGWVEGTAPPIPGLYTDSEEAETPLE